MSRFFSINGFWKDNKEEFEGYIVKEYDDAEEDEQADSQIFEYGWGEGDIQKAIEEGEETNGDFVITSYEEINF